MKILTANPSDSLALVDLEFGAALSFEALQQHVSSTANSFTTDRKLLAFVMPDGHVVDAVVLLGLLCAGHCAALLDPTASSAHINSLVAAYKPDVIIAPHRSKVLLQSIQGYRRQRCPGTEKLFGARCDAWFAQVSDQHEAIHVDLAVLLPTSGSTGNPKLVRLSKKNIESNLAAIIAALDINPQDKVCGHLPTHYSFGLSVMLSHLAAGACVVLNRHSFIGRPFWEVVQSSQCTTLPGVPFHFENLARLRLNKLNVPMLKRFLQAGGALRTDILVSIASMIEAHDGEFFIMYGQTEAAPRMTTLPAGEIFLKPGSVGPTLSGGRIEIVEQSGEVADPAGSGEIIYYGPNVMMGYAVSRSCLNKGDEMGGRLATGDIGYLDQDSYLYVTGRKSRIGKVFGNRINLDDIESLGSNFGRVAAVETGGVISIFVESSEDVRRAKLITELAKLTGLHSSAFNLYTLDQLPRLRNGKIDYVALMDRCK